MSGRTAGHQLMEGEISGHMIHINTTQPVLRGHHWDNKKDGLIRQVTS